MSTKEFDVLDEFGLRGRTQSTSTESPTPPTLYDGVDYMAQELKTVMASQRELRASSEKHLKSMLDQVTDALAKKLER